MNSLSVAVADGVATLSIQRPRPAMPSTSPSSARCIWRSTKFKKATAAHERWCITGSNDVFCSGLDLHSVDLKTQEARQRAHFEMRRFMDPSDPAAERISAFPSSPPSTVRRLARG